MATSRARNALGRCHHCPELAVTTVTFDGEERPVCRIHEREHERRYGD